jgi:hypothetical protein
MAQDDVFNLGESEAGSYLNNKQKTNDGLLRPKLEEGKDGKRELVIRILPNLMTNGKIGPTAIEKHIHYADFKNNPDLQGYFDCLKNTNIGKDCPLCKTYWALKNSKNPNDEDKAKLISRSTKYYSYAYVVEDKQVPENEGKIFIFPFGYKIFTKIKAKAESTRKPCKVEDLVYGANLSLVIQEVGGFYNYDASEFEAPEAITIDGKQLKVGADGKIAPGEKERVVEFLKSREFNLEDFMPKDWTPEQYDKANKIIALLSGVSYDASSASEPASSKKPASKPLTSAAVFEDDDDEDEEEQKPAKKATKAETKVEASEATEASDDKAIAASKKKAKAFFDDED